MAPDLTTAQSYVARCDYISYLKLLHARSVHEGCSHHLADKTQEVDGGPDKEELLGTVPEPDVGETRQDGEYLCRESVVRATEGNIDVPREHYQFLSEAKR